MIDKILKILEKVCSIDEIIYPDTELIDSNILDSLALVQLIYELENMGIELQLTQISRHQLRYPYVIANLIDSMCLKK